MSRSLPARRKGRAGKVVPAKRSPARKVKPPMSPEERRKLEEEIYRLLENCHGPAATALPGLDEATATDEERARLVSELAVLDSPRLREGANGAPVVDGDLAQWFDKLQESTGSTNWLLQDLLMRSAALATGCAEEQPKKSFVTRVNAALAFMHAIAPRTPLEGLLATQMAAAHAMAMRATDYACWSQDHDVKTNWARLATKFMGTFVQQVEALERLRGKGGTTQTVRVEHVTVEAGGQAIVGAVTPGEGAGWNTKPRNEPMHDAAPRPAESAEDDRAASTPSADERAVACTVARPVRRKGTRTR